MDKSKYKCWYDMLRRCNSPNAKNYPDYGGRGITVCKEWSSFEVWYDFVSKLTHFSEEGYTFDRIDNDGHYEPGNVRWATRKEQRHNQRSLRKLKLKGKCKKGHDISVVGRYPQPGETSENASGPCKACQVKRSVNSMKKIYAKNRDKKLNASTSTVV